MAFSVEAGPTFSYALTSKAITKYRILGYTSKQDEDLFARNDSYNRFDLGLNLSVAAERRRVYFRVGTDFGLSNLYKNVPVGISSSMRNRGFHVMLGYRF